MKRRLSLFFALLLSLLLVSCGKLGASSSTTAAASSAPVSSSAVSGETAPENVPSTAGSQNGPAASMASGPDASPEDSAPEEELLPEDGAYTSKEDVALYLLQYGRLPDNFITKQEARALGWPGGDLEPYAPGMCIGGDRFGNHEKLLPEAPGRSYHECDIDTLGASKRGAKRLVYSTDGLIYYTEDHYETFELLYDNTKS